MRKWSACPDCQVWPIVVGRRPIKLVCDNGASNGIGIGCFLRVYATGAKINHWLKGSAPISDTQSYSVHPWLDLSDLFRFKLHLIIYQVVYILIEFDNIESRLKMLKAGNCFCQFDSMRSNLIKPDASSRLRIILKFFRIWHKNPWQIDR